MSEEFMRSVPRIRLKQVREGRVRFPIAAVVRPEDVYQAVRAFYKGRYREVLSVLCLDAQNVPVSFSVVSIGNLNITRTRPVDLLKVAILSNALSMILIHNHPSGRLEPSDEDVEFTREIARAGELMGVELYDHVVVTDRGYTSLRKRGCV